MRILNLVTTRRSFYRAQEAALDAANIEYTTVTVPGTHRGHADGVEQRSVWDYLRFYPTVLRKSLSEYDIVHANFGLTAPFAVAQPRLPVVVSLWGSEFHENKYEALIASATKRADEVIVPSQMMRRFVRRDNHCIPYPIDGDLFSPMSKAEARSKLDWDADETVVLFPSAPGRPEKNYRLAERVVEGVAQPVRLYPCIDEPYERMPLLMNASDAVLVTSTYETGPMVVKEAVACNVPVVSTPVGFVSDVLDGVANSSTGKSAEELRRALETVLDANARADGRHKVVAYDIADMGAQLRRVYERCTDRRQRSGPVPIEISTPQ